MLLGEDVTALFLVLSLAEEVLLHYWLVYVLDAVFGTAYLACTALQVS